MKKRLLAIIAAAAMVVTMIPSMVFAATPEASFGGVNYDTLQEAINAASAASGTHEINVLNDVSGDVTIKQKEGVNITIKGNGNEFNGTIYIHGDSRFDKAETLTIDGFKFVAKVGSHDFISSNSTDSDKRYAHNVTIQNCTFEADDAFVDVVAMRFRQAYNIQVKNCTATNMHSLMWGTGGNGLEFDTVKTEDCENGISVGTTDDVVVKNSVIEAVGSDGYGIRANAEGPYSMTIENCVIDAYVPVMIRNATTTEKYDLTLKDNELTASNNEGITVAVSDAEDIEVLESANVDIETITTPSTPTQTPDKSPNTGDNSMAPIAVAGLFMAAMAAVVATRRRTN